MKRSWFGAALLVLLLISAIGTARIMQEIHRPVVRDLRLAAGCALSNDWDSADTLSQEAAGHWHRWRSVRLCFADHGPTEEIDRGFAGLYIYCQEEERAEFAAACKELARQVDAIAQAHSLNLWNLF